MSEPITIKTLLEAGVHFGHQTRRWNPKMKPYIFGSRGDIYILDLKKTIIELDKAYSYVSDMAGKGGTILFVGTKKQAQQAVKSAAERCGMPYVDARWLGGMLTNFVTISERIKCMEELEAEAADGRLDLLPKKEQQLKKKKLAKLVTNLGGVRDMKSLPTAVFVVDTKREEIAIREAHRLGIKVIGMLDTNADPDEVDFGIPANDDAIRSVDMMCQLMADAVLAGKATNVSETEMAAAAQAPQTEAALEAVDAAAPAPAAEATPVAEAPAPAAAEGAADPAAE